jgi:amidase
MADDLTALDTTALAKLVRRGEAAPLELVDAAIARIEALNPELNAVVTTRFDRARDEAASPDLPDGPFRGVPFLLKDLACTMAGEPDHEGMRVLKETGHTAEIDTHLARRFRAAGLVVLGRTNTPELGIMGTTEPQSYGPTRNPWDVARTPGGSSGGSAAAVASGMVAAAQASDGGGSIRIPSSCCGLVGLKTSRGRVSVGPAGGELTRFLSVQFAVTRSVRDVAALLDVAAGEEPGDPIVAPPPARPFVSEVGADPGRLRIGLMTSSPAGVSEVHPDCVAAAEGTAKLLESFGHNVEIAYPAAFDERERLTAFAAVWAANTASALAHWGRVLGRELTEADVEPLTWVEAERGRGVSAVEFLDAVAAMQAFTRRFAQWWTGSGGGGGFDLLLSSTLGEPPPPLGTLSTPDEPYAGYARTGAFTPYTPTFNITGQPAITLPLATSDDGLPVGVHLAAAYGRDDVLIRVAAQLEAALPWTARRPAVHA